MSELGERFHYARWDFIIPKSIRDLSPYVREQLIDTVVATLQGKRGAPLRSSRHATTWKAQVASTTGEPINIFVKQLDPARGLLEKAKALTRARRSEHVLRISEAMRGGNFGVPRVLLIGKNRDTGHEVIVMNEVAGFMLTRWMNPRFQTPMSIRREILHKLGAEVARLHRCGYIHGDLTPYNVFAAVDHEVSIIFIDHEGTEVATRLSINLARDRMRNLVQLGHFDIPGVSRTDKLRVLGSYLKATGFSLRAKRETFHGLVEMIERRRIRDRAIARVSAQPTKIAEVGAGEVND